MGHLRQRRGCLIGAGVAALLVAMAAAVVVTLALLISPPWPQRAAVRIEPLRPTLADAAVTPDNGFFYLRRLADHREDFEHLRVPVAVPTAPEPEDEMAVMFPPPPDPSQPTPEFSLLGSEWLAFHREGYRPAAFPHLERLLEQAALPIELCQRAAACVGTQVATVTRYDDELLYVGPVGETANLLAFRIELQAAEGNWQGVTQDARVALTCARQVACGGGVLNHLVSYACTNKTCASLRRIALAHTVPPATTHALLGLLAEQEQRLEPLAEGLRFERFAGLHLAEIAAGREKGFDPDIDRIARWTRPLLWLLTSSETRMRRHVTDTFSLLIQDAEAPYTRDPPGWRTIARFINDSREHVPFGLLGDDPVGRVAVMILVPGMCQFREREVTTRAVLRGTAAVLSLQAWRQAQAGHPPECLEQLVPEWLADLPADPCADAPHAPLRYEPQSNGWRLWSVGPDQKDDGGTHNLLRPDRDSFRADLADLCFHSAEFAPAAERPGGK